MEAFAIIVAVLLITLFVVIASLSARVASLESAVKALRQAQASRPLAPAFVSPITPPIAPPITTARPITPAAVAPDSATGAHPPIAAAAAVRAPAGGAPTTAHRPAPDSAPRPHRAVIAPAAPPDALTQLIAFVRDNGFALGGLVLLMVGLAFLFPILVSHHLFPPALRLALSALTGIVLLVIGARLSAGRPAYADALQGGGVAIQYLTVWGAHRVYGFIGADAAFALFVALSLILLVIATHKRRLSLAGIALFGAYLAPLMIDLPTTTLFAPLRYAFLLALVAAYAAWRLEAFALNFEPMLLTSLLGALALDHGATLAPLNSPLAMLLGAFALLYAVLPGVALPRQGSPEGAAALRQRSLLLMLAPPLILAVISRLDPLDWHSLKTGLAAMAILHGACAVVAWHSSQGARVLLPWWSRNAFIYATIAIAMQLTAAHVSLFLALEGSVLMLAPLAVRGALERLAAAVLLLAATVLWVLVEPSVWSLTPLVLAAGFGLYGLVTAPAAADAVERNAATVLAVLFSYLFWLLPCHATFGFDALLSLTLLQASVCTVLLTILSATNPKQRSAGRLVYGALPILAIALLAFGLHDLDTGVAALTAASLLLLLFWLIASVCLRHIEARAKQTGARVVAALLGLTAASEVLAAMLAQTSPAHVPLVAIFTEPHAGTATTMLWGAVALALIAQARRQPQWRPAGLWLMGLAGAKLIAFDLAATGSLGRVIAFIGLGILYLIAGALKPAAEIPVRKA